MSYEYDDTSKREFYEYYANESLNETTLQRFKNVKRDVLNQCRNEQASLHVADIGCGAGTNSIIWAEDGHKLHALDVNAPLIELARKRAADAGYDIDFRVGTALELPWENESMDVCLAPELLEHVADWEECLDEFCRILKPGGLLYVSTSSKLCPVQQEYTLPLYSWYPARVKRYCEKLAVTTRPEIANYATYPAVNWFSFYQLKNKLAEKEFQSMDRFDIMDTSEKASGAKKVINLIRRFSFLRLLAHIATPYTVVMARKRV